VLTLTDGLGVPSTKRTLRRGPVKEAAVRADEAAAACGVDEDGIIVTTPTERGRPTRTHQDARPMRRYNHSAVTCAHESHDSPCSSEQRRFNRSFLASDHCSPHPCTIVACPCARIRMHGRSSCTLRMCVLSPVVVCVSCVLSMRDGDDRGASFAGVAWTKDESNRTTWWTRGTHEERRHHETSMRWRWRRRRWCRSRER
jgi:hypothetical protein